MNLSHTVIFLASVLAVSAVADGQPRTRAWSMAPANAGLSIERIEYDGTTRSAKMTFRNTAKVEVSAFAWTGRIANLGASNKTHQEFVDLLPEIALRAAGANFMHRDTGTSLRPDETYSVSWTVPVEWGPVPASSITCDLNLVVYSDGTALGDAMAADRVFAGRQAEIADVRAVLARVRGLPRKATDSSEVASVVDDLTRANNGTVGHTLKRQLFIATQFLRLHQRGGWSAVDDLVSLQEAVANEMAKQGHKKG